MDVGPPRKRQRQESDKRRNENRLFVPFRTLGLVTNQVPIVVQTRSFKGASDGPRIHILTCLGKSWALWEGGKMTLLFVGPDTPKQISYLAMDDDAVWAAAGAHAIKYLRGKEVLRATNPLGSSLAFITIFGQQLLALTEDGGRMLCWNTETAELESTIQFDTDFTATYILHPATYINKVLVSSVQGNMQLWNIRTETCIHRFSSSNLTSQNGTDAITALTQSPAIDIVGIGFASGEISIYDVRADERLMRMIMDGGSVRALGFRTDGQAILASASSTGNLALWDLNEGGRLLHMVRGAHDGTISTVEWVPHQPLLITSGEDNSVKQWLFDSPSAAPRLLKYRSGHHAPPHLIRYYGDDGKQLLTASRDRSLRCTSVVRDSRSFELSQGPLAKKASTSIPIASLKFPPVISISYSSARAKDWDDILTAHTDETFVRTWSMQNKKLGKHALGFADGDKSKNKPLGSAKAVCVTACGNFGIAGSSNGNISMWNLQSGVKRKIFDIGPCPTEVSDRFRVTNKKTASGRCITGLATDSLNRMLVASTLDGTINFFDFHSTKLEHYIVLPSTVVSILLHNSCLLAVICDDLIVRLIDIEMRRIVREFGGFRARVLDMTFSPDSRWLVTSSLDSIIRTFDIPTGRLIDAFRTSSVATSVSFSPTNDFLATSHVDSVGIYLWANRAQYDEVSFQTVEENDIAETELPSIEGLVEDDGKSCLIGPLLLIPLLALASLSPLTSKSTSVDVFSTPLQLEGELVTLTLLPRSRWQTLINLDVIQQRNKPKEPPKAPEKAPFFLPSLPGVEPRFALPATKTDSEPKSSQRLNNRSGNSQSVFFEKLAAEAIDGDYECFFAFVKTLSPASLDLELRSMTTLDSIHLFLTALRQRLLTRRDFEAVQALQKVFLAMQAETIVANQELADEMKKLLQVQQKESEKVLELISSSLGTLSFVRDTV